ncbi:MAG TPA: DMT family transporter [Candidatus Sulfotelmatobacter sp.]|nr:DMT family transporter [Candidatus Sulfotelmatobacter sp.]
MLGKKNNAVLALSLVFAVFLWGGNNSGTKFIVTTWPPVWTGGSRFFCAGLLLLALLRWTDWLGSRHALTPQISRRLWWQGGLSLATYIVVFNTALRYTSASHVALYLGASPVWALLWEGPPARNWNSAQRYGAATLALGGVFVLFWPALKVASGNWLGEVLGLTASVLWTAYGRQCRALGTHLSGAETSAHTMWRAGLMLLPLGLIEIYKTGLVLRTNLALVQVYCIIAGGVVAFAIWSNALRFWPTSKVLLFNNLIPLSTMSWAHVCLREPVTPTFWVAMTLIVAGVILGQANWQKLVVWRMAPSE